MVPVVLDTGRLKLAVIGGGAGALGRLRLLKAQGAEPAAVYAPEPDENLAEEAGEALVRRLPTDAEIAAIDLLFVGDLADGEAASIATRARAAKTLVNTLDKGAFCDMHMPALMRRGALVLAVSTEGTVPALARRVAQALSQRFGPEWAGRIAESGAERERLRAQGVSGAALSRAMNDYIDAKGWLA